MPKKKTYRLVTRSDFDGLVCAVLLKELKLIDEIIFVHPKDMQDGLVEITENDITTNLPYVANCYLAFDHHLSEVSRSNGKIPKNHIIYPNEPSAARVVYEYYGGRNTFPNIDIEILEAVDKGDSANFTQDEILYPSDWTLFNFLLDSRTGLGRFRSFRVSNYQLMMDIIDHCKNYDINDIIKHPDVAERVTLYFNQTEKFRKQIMRCAKKYDELVVLNLRKEETIYAGNRFMIYALFPECNISIHVLWGKEKKNTVFAIGKSIINKTSDVNIGDLCLSYGGGGHKNAGTCQVSNKDANKDLKDIITKITAQE